ncbi:MAG: hypothetical protein R2744_01615 [Bacteroidales bacterium]
MEKGLEIIRGLRGFTAMQSPTMLLMPPAEAEKYRSFLNMSRGIMIKGWYLRILKEKNISIPTVLTRKENSRQD